MIKKFFLLSFSLIISFCLIEIFLIFFGRYQNLTKNNLIPSPAIYERSFSSKQFYKHPDLNFKIENIFDADGVKNYEHTPTSLKKNIISFFGDSMTENIAITKNFEFTKVLQKLNDDYNFINYGIGGYASDQVFIRFLKYQNHDFKHVFYLFMPLDQVLNTSSKFLDNGQFFIEKPSLNYIFLIIGKLNFTYLLIDTYYFFKSKIKKTFSLSNIDNYNSILANKIYDKFYSKNSSNCDQKIFINIEITSTFKNDECVNNFLNLLKIFKNKVEKKNAKFHILIYPEKNNMIFFNNLMKLSDEKFSYFFLDSDLLVYSQFDERNISFKNDGHWNEYGNIVFAKNLIDIFDKLGIKFDNLDLSKYFNEIDSLYLKYK